MKQYLCFDIGGTDIKFGVINENYDFIFHDIMPTKAKDGGLSIIMRVIDKINTLKSSYQIEGVAISSAGVIDPFKGEVIYATNAIPNYIGVKIKELVETNTNISCEVLNDVKCFALCEANIGSAKGCSSFLTITIGTGIGGAIYINNELYYGKDFSAGEWGRMSILSEKFEDVASITGLCRLANQYIKEDNWNGKLIFDLYDENNEQAKKAVDIFYNHLATGIMNLIYIFNPEKVIIGGGISKRGDKFINELLTHIKQKIETKFLENTLIQLAKFNNDSGMMGALFHYLNMKNKE